MLSHHSARRRNLTSARLVGMVHNHGSIKGEIMSLPNEVLEALFFAATVGVGPFWILMALRPHATATRRVMITPWPVIALALVYAVLVLPNLGAILGTLANPTLSAISTSLATPAGSLAVWLHVLAFDLIVGRFIWLDGLERGVGAPLRIASLALALLIGPIGLLVHLALRPRDPRSGSQAVS